MAEVCCGIDEPRIDARLALPSHGIPQHIRQTPAATLLRRPVVLRAIGARRAAPRAELTTRLINSSERTRLTFAVGEAFTERTVLTGSHFRVIYFSFVRTELARSFGGVVKLCISARLTGSRLLVEELCVFGTKTLTCT